MKNLRTLFLMLFAAVSLSSLAEETTTSLVLTFNDETTASYNLATQPVVTFDETNLIITAESVETKYARADVKEFHFAISTDGIHSVNAGTTLAFRYVDNQTIELSGTEGQKAELYSADGKLIRSTQAQNGVCTLSVRDCASGNYIVRAGHQSIKVLKK